MIRYEDISLAWSVPADATLTTVTAALAVPVGSVLELVELDGKRSAGTASANWTLNIYDNSGLGGDALVASFAAASTDPINQRDLVRHCRADASGQLYVSVTADVAGDAFAGRLILRRTR